MKWQAVIVNGSTQSVIQGYSYKQIIELLKILRFDCAYIVYPDGGFEYYNNEKEFIDFIDIEEEDIDE